MKRYYFLSFWIILAIAFTNVLNGEENKSHIDVLYFHATLRCQGCLTIEENIMNSMNNLFEKQLKDSLIVSSSLDFLQPENEHFQYDYKFESQTLIISLKKNGKEVKWKNLDKIWDYSGDFEKFQKYVKKEIEMYLKEIYREKL